jgi:hypothetical protein
MNISRVKSWQWQGRQTATHNPIAGNLFALIRSHIRGTDSRLYLADVKDYLEQRNGFYYPELRVIWDSKSRKIFTYKCFPKLIAEGLSPSTESFD